MSGSGAVIRVLLVDDHAIERQGVRSLLDAQSDLTVVGEAPDGLEALPLVGSCSPDVIVTETITETKYKDRIKEVIRYVPTSGTVCPADPEFVRLFNAQD